MRLQSFMRMAPAAMLAGSVTASTVFAGSETVDYPSGPTFIPPAASSSSPAFIPPSVKATGGITSDGGAQAMANAMQANPQTTAQVVAAINNVRNFCGRLAAQEYVIDCLSAQLADVAARMPESGDYADARMVLDQAARELRAVTMRYRSTTMPRGTARSSGTDGQASARPLTAVRGEDLDAAKQQATRIIEEAATQLLRSSQAGEERRVHFEQIAEAVDSNKVLLRST